MSDQFKRVEKLDDQAMALMESLADLMAGRPIDAVLNALATAVQRFIVEELKMADEEIEYALLRAAASVKTMMGGKAPTRGDQLRRAFFLASCLTLLTPTINYLEGQR